MSDEVDHRGFSPSVNESRIISLLTVPFFQDDIKRDYAKYRIRVMINGKYYVGELELSE